MDNVRELAELIADGGVVVLSGAGLSTESGIPDYRGPTGRARKAEPMTYQTFVGSAAARQRYWARSHIGWRQISGVTPNAGHLAVAELERRGLVTGVITQNVDGLHQAAGAVRVVELHGALDRVACLSCRARSPRAELEARLARANPGWDAVAVRYNPDGDAVLDEALIEGFTVVGCRDCGGPLKPDVVFFGENVPRPRTDECFAMVGAARTLLVLGSSLAVKSGRRFVERAAALGLAVAIVNQGPTGGDVHAVVRVDAPLGATLTELISPRSVATG